MAGTTAELGQEDVTVAVITGGHPYDVRGFTHMFRRIRAADCYIHHLEDFVCAGAQAQEYDVALFYTMPEPQPPRNTGGWEDRIQPALEELGTTEQGIFLLHHAILTYWDWPFWSDIVGIRQRHLWGEHGYHHDQEIRVRISDQDHPITRGLTDWTITDETYEMDEPAADNRILLTTDPPQSMTAIGWTRTFRQSRVFCLGLGHDNQAYADDGLRQVIERGIQWCARRI